MNYQALTNEQIRLALSFCDVEDQETWVMCGMAVKSELGEAGREMWLEWSALGSTFKLKEANNRWKSFKMTGNTRIGSLIFEAQKYGFKLEKDAPKVSPYVQEQRKKQRLEAERQAKIEEQKSAIIDKPRNLEEQAISLVGKDIYIKLIKGYTEKQWGRECKDLPTFIIKRLPVRYTYDNNYFNDRYQGIPIGGYNKIVEKMLINSPKLQ